MKILNHYSYNFDEIEKESGGGEVISIPDQSLSVKEILNRFRRGDIDLSSIERKAYYDDDEDINTFIDQVDDISDLASIVQTAQNRISYLHDSKNREEKYENTQEVPKISDESEQS